MEASTTPARSTDANAEQAAAHVAQLDDADEVRAFVEGDTRVTVTTAAERRLTELGEQAAPSTEQTIAASNEGNIAALQTGYLQGEPGPRSERGKPLRPTGHDGPVTVRTRYPLDNFDSRLEGVPVINSTGVTVKPDRVAALVKAADASGAQLEEV